MTRAGRATSYQAACLHITKFCLPEGTLQQAPEKGGNFPREKDIRKEIDDHDISLEGSGEIHSGGGNHGRKEDQLPQKG